MGIKSVQDGYKLRKEITTSDVRQICGSQGIEIKTIALKTGSFGKRIFFINNEFLLRVSGATMAPEQERFRRVASLDAVPQIVQVGVLEREVAPIYYTLLTLLPGDDFLDAYKETTLPQQVQLGKDVAVFLDNLYAFAGTQYDIGLYIPAIPKYTGKWRDGHQKYWGMLKHGVGALRLTSDSLKVFDKAFQYLNASVDVLAYQTGPKLLHNDFHPRNIVLNQGEFSGVIDWECSQYGEADFELCHLIHWCLYPPEPQMDFRPFLRSLFQSTPKCAQVPNFAERLTIYQIEHEIQQIIWNSEYSESWRVPRLIHWMEDGVDDLFREIL